MGKMKIYGHTNGGRYTADGVAERLSLFSIYKKNNNPIRSIHAE